jgi:hypothetical protein
MIIPSLGYSLLGLYFILRDKALFCVTVSNRPLAGRELHFIRPEALVFMVPLSFSLGVLGKSTRDVSFGSGKYLVSKKKSEIIPLLESFHLSSIPLDICHNVLALFLNPISFSYLVPCLLWYPAK